MMLEVTGGLVCSKEYKCVVLFYLIVEQTKMSDMPN